MNLFHRFLTLVFILVISTTAMAKGPGFSKGNFSKGPSKNSSFKSGGSINRGSSINRGGFNQSRRSPNRSPVSKPQLSRQSFNNSTKMKSSFSQRQKFTPNSISRQPSKFNNTFKPSRPITSSITNKFPTKFSNKVPGKVTNRQPSNSISSRPKFPNVNPNLSKISGKNIGKLQDKIQGKLPGKILGRDPIRKPKLKQLDPKLEILKTKLGDFKPKPTEIGQIPGRQPGGPSPGVPTPTPPNNPPVADHDDHDNHGKHVHFHWHKPICLPPIVRCPPPRVCPPCVLAICPQAEVVIIEQSTEQILINFLEEPTEPAFVIDLQVDTEVSLEIDGLSELPGALVLDVNGIGLPVEILGAEEGLVSIQVPSVGLSEPQLGKLYVLNGDLQLVSAVAARVHPAAQ